MSLPDLGRIYNSALRMVVYPTLRVVVEKAPPGVARRLFGITRLLSSRLD